MLFRSSFDHCQIQGSLMVKKTPPQKLFFFSYFSRFSLFLELLGYLDPKIDPCEDFYNYACGGWIKKNPLPEKKFTWNQFTKLEDESTQFMREILQSKEVQAEYSKVKQSIS